MKKGIVIFLFCSLGVQLVQAQTPVQIASRCAQAVGGRAAWQNVEFVQYAGNMRIDEKKYPIKFYQKMPNLYRLEATVEDNVIVEAFDGKRAWDINPFGLYGEKAHLKTKIESAEAAEQNMQTDLMDYKKKGSQLFLLDTINYNGLQVFYLKLIKNNENEVLYFIDRATYLPVMAKLVINSGIASGAAVEMHYADYRQIGDVVLPFSIKMVANDVVLQELTYSKAELGVRVNPAIFDYIE